MPKPSAIGRASLGGLVLLCGCWAKSERELVVYVALDAQFSQPVLKRFQAETGIKVLAKYDVESTKTVGLTNEIIAEAARPRCDVFWNNEILNTLRLARRDLLLAYASPQRARIPQAFRAADATWTGFAARARVLLVNTERLPDRTSWPTRVTDLAAPQWRQQVGMAKPLFGSTATHATVLMHRWHEERFRTFFAAVRDNARIYSGNKQVALAVARGSIDWGLTDTDDAIIEVDRGMPVRIIYPDQDAGEMGTLLIPNTVCVIKGPPHADLAATLVDYLLSAQVEAYLAACPSGQIPLAADVSQQSRLQLPKDLRTMDVDFEAVAACWDDCARVLKELFMGS